MTQSIIKAPVFPFFSMSFFCHTIFSASNADLLDF